MILAVLVQDDFNTALRILDGTRYNDTNTALRILDGTRYNDTTCVVSLRPVRLPSTTCTSYKYHRETFKLIVWKVLNGVLFKKLTKAREEGRGVLGDLETHWHHRGVNM